VMSDSLLQEALYYKVDYNITTGHLVVYHAVLQGHLIRANEGLLRDDLLRLSVAWSCSCTAPQQLAFLMEQLSRPSSALSRQIPQSQVMPVSALGLLFMVFLKKATKKTSVTH